MKEEIQSDIILLVSRLVDILGSDAVALDGRHTPALYSRFLSGLLIKYHNVSPHRPDSPASEDLKFYPQFGSDRSLTPPQVYSWPDVGLAYSPSVSPAGSDASGDYLIYQHAGDLDMDLSLSHFINTVTGEKHSQDAKNDFRDREKWDTWNIDNARAVYS